MAKRKANKKSADDLVKAFGLPKSAPPKAYSDPLGWDEAPFRPPIPLMPQYVRGSENWFMRTMRASTSTLRHWISFFPNHFTAEKPTNSSSGL